MKKTKKFLLIFLIFSLVLFFSGCSKRQKEEDENLLLLKNKVNEMMFDMTCYAITGYTDNDSFYVRRFFYPQVLKDFLARKCINDGRIYYCAENFFPDYLGILNSVGYFDGVSDSGDWIDDLLIRLEEERIALEINEMDEILNESLEHEFKVDEAAEIEKMFTDEVKSREITGKNNQLSFMEFENEILIPQKTADGYIVIHSSGNNTERNFYDANFRLVTKENWNIGNSSEGKLIETNDFEYFEDTNVVSIKLVKLEESEIKYIYTKEGLISEKIEYDLYKDKSYPVTKSLFKYNEDNKIVNQILETYTYKKNYSKISETFTKQYLYTYNEVEDIPADFEYYENGFLKKRNKYSTEKGNYTSQIFFEDNFAVKTYFENELRVRDVYTHNNQVIREKIYEN